MLVNITFRKYSPEVLRLCAKCPSNLKIYIFLCNENYCLYPCQNTHLFAKRIVKSVSVAIKKRIVKYPFILPADTRLAIRPVFVTDFIRRYL